MAEVTVIKVLEAVGVTDASVGRSEGERLGAVLRNFLVHGGDSLRLDFEGVETLTPSAASLMLSRAISVDPRALDKIVFINVPENIRAVLIESLNSLRGIQEARQ